MTDLHVTWDQYHHLVERLAVQIHASQWSFDQIVCIARGGLRIGDVLSRTFNLPLAILSTRSYTESEGTLRGKLAIAEHMTMTSEQLGPRILLVDDMVDSGHTLKAVHEILPQRYSGIREVRTAVLWYKACSIFPPDYCVTHLPDSPWIHQPFELYDHTRPAELAQRLRNALAP